MRKVKLKSSLTRGLACLWGSKSPPLTTVDEKTINADQKHHEQARYIMLELCPRKY